MHLKKWGSAKYIFSIITENGVVMLRSRGTDLTSVWKKWWWYLVVTIVHGSS